MADLREQLQSIYQRHGELTPQVVLDEARDPSHPLHNRFEWRDDVAAEQWRKQQAHDLIVSVKVTYRDDKQGLREVRAFHAVRQGNGHVYRSTDDIVRDEVATKALLADMEREWRQLHRRYSHFAEFADMVRRDIDGAAA